MTDIVFILRRTRLPEGYSQTMLGQAADEIERLRQELEIAKDLIGNARQESFEAGQRFR